MATLIPTDDTKPTENIEVPPEGIAGVFRSYLNLWVQETDLLHDRTRDGSVWWYLKDGNTYLNKRAAAWRKARGMRCGGLFGPVVYTSKDEFTQISSKTADP
jgi:hypothetical protein